MHTPIRIVGRQQRPCNLIIISSVSAVHIVVFWTATTLHHLNRGVTCRQHCLVCPLQDYSLDVLRAAGTALLFKTRSIVVHLHGIRLLSTRWLKSQFNIASYPHDKQFRLKKLCKYARGTTRVSLCHCFTTEGTSDQPLTCFTSFVLVFHRQPESYPSYGHQGRTTAELTRLQTTLACSIGQSEACVEMHSWQTGSMLCCHRICGELVVACA